VVIGYADAVRVFVDPSVLAAGELVVRGDEHHYLAYARRARVGDAVELVDGAGRRAAATIAAIASDATTLAVGAPEVIASKPPFVRVLIPLIKGDRMDTCLEKLVEVGVDEIVIWPAARAVVRLDADRRDSRLAKFAAMIQAAARQSGRAQVPSVRIVDDAIAALSDGLVAKRTSMRIVLDPTSDASLAVGDAMEITIASGPEGGMTADECAHFAKAGFAGIGLGPRILRAETAPIVAVSVIRALTQS
jgi:16S rRNA (uracil1498-N3)-methyltransferase